MQFEARHRREGEVCVGTSKVGLRWISLWADHNLAAAIDTLLG